MFTEHFEPPHHLSFHAPCFACGATWKYMPGSRTHEMDHQAGCDWLIQQDAEESYEAAVTAPHQAT